MLYFLSTELLMPKKHKKNEHCSDKRTLVAQAGEAEG